MYLLFRWHNLMPGDYYSKGIGEKIILRAFVHKENEERKKEYPE